MRAYIAGVLGLAIALPVLAQQAGERDLVLLREAMDGRLKDAASARLKDVVIGKDGTTCGLVNAKNSYGAYAGYEPFIAMKLSTGKFFIVDIGEASGQVCRDRGL
ncbi:TPA: hypothetical protein ACHS85_000172 [Pseudomonas aeruginosa]|uniref:hypothetical protein n=1 Tax=Pseudomonas aeruginosa TaxID=287 RepID=UPI002937933D|nr:hypothetical protein [Pseudomonas aeruginosa]